MIKAIVELTPSEEEHIVSVAKHLFSVLKPGMCTMTKRHGYAKYEFSGEYTQELVDALGHEPTEEELVLIADGGYSHFGAHCVIKDRKFCGVVYND